MKDCINFAKNNPDKTYYSSKKWAHQKSMDNMDKMKKHGKEFIKVTKNWVSFSILVIKAYRFITLILATAIYMTKNKQKMTKILIFLNLYF